MITSGINFFEAGGQRIQSPSFQIDAGSHLHIDAETPQLALAAALAIFRVDPEMVERNSGGNSIGAGASRISYVSPTPRSELSRFTETVSEEIEIGFLEPSRSVLGKLCSALRLDSLLLRPPEELSGGETAKVILAAHLARPADILILDRVLDELDQQARISLNNYLRELPKPITIVTIGNCHNDFSPDLELHISCGIAELSKYEPLRVEKNVEPNHSLTLLNGSVSPCESPPIVQVRALTARRGEREIFSNIAFTIGKGELFWLLGPNGCGKSTLLEVLSGLIPAASGSEIHIRRDSLNAAEPNLAKFSAYSPQDPEGDVTELTLLDEVRLAQQSSSRMKVQKTDAETWLDDVGVTPIIAQSLLSDDIQYRKLASVLASFNRNRFLVLLDEPTLFLNDMGRRIVCSAINSHVKKGGAVICATHDLLLRETVTNNWKEL